MDMHLVIIHQPGFPQNQPVDLGFELLVPTLYCDPQVTSLKFDHTDTVS